MPGDFLVTVGESNLDSGCRAGCGAKEDSGGGNFFDSSAASSEGEYVRGERVKELITLNTI